jgi:hypothetical protein
VGRAQVKARFVANPGPLPHLRRQGLHPVQYRLPP